MNRETMTKKKKQPVATVRLGNIKAAVWENESNGSFWYNVSFSVLYKNKDDEWCSSNYFKARDLLRMAKVAELAHDYVLMELEEKLVITETEYVTYTDYER